jgi:hypothetical protein
MVLIKLEPMNQPKEEIEPRIRLRQGFLLRQGFGGQDDGQVSRRGTDEEDGKSQNSNLKFQERGSIIKLGKKRKQPQINRIDIRDIQLGRKSNVRIF